MCARGPLPLVALLWLPCLLASPSPAQGAEEELILAIEPGYARLQTPDDGRHGLAGHLSVRLGLTDALWLATSVGGLQFPGVEGRESRTFFEAFAGIVAALDVFRTIPFAEVMGGAVVSGGRVGATLRIGIGADYLISRTVSLGVALRYHPLPEPLGDHLLSAQLRLAWRLEL